MISQFMAGLPDKAAAQEEFVLDLLDADVHGPA